MSLVKQEDRAKYTRFIWVFYLAFPFVMQGFKPEDVRSNKAAYILPVTAQLNFNGKAIKLEVARSKFAVTHGLTYRNDIDNDRGMLYQLDAPTIFNGKGMKFPTALVFIQNGKVVDIQRVQPCGEQEQKCLEYRTNVAYNEVLEVKQNIPIMLGMTVGATLNINYIPQ
jgi:uncharacterized membrane protein (UPF0127 family)